MVGVLLLAPLILVTLTLWSLQNASLATEVAVRHAARAFVQHADLGQARAAAEGSVSSALRAHGITGDTSVQVRCQPAAQCLSPGSLVEVSVVVHVPVWSGVLSGMSLPVSLPMSASHVAQVSSYGGVG